MNRLKSQLKVGIPNAQVSLKKSKETLMSIQRAEIEKLREEVSNAITSSPLPYCVVSCNNVTNEALEVVIAELTSLGYNVKYDRGILDLDWSRS